jgi:hypothetical protein
VEEPEDKADEQHRAASGELVVERAFAFRFRVARESLNVAKDAQPIRQRHGGLLCGKPGRQRARARQRQASRRQHN